MPIDTDMASPSASSRSKIRTDLSPVHRRVVRVGAATGWLVASLFLIGGALSGDQHFYLEAIAPTLAAALMTAMILLKAENGGVALFGSALVIVVMYTLIGTPVSVIPVAVTLVVICGVGTLLLGNHRLAITGVMGVLLFATPHLWQFELEEAIQLGLIMGVTFLAVAVVFITVRNAATALETRFETLFDNSPTAVLEEDWSGALDYVRSEYSGRPDRILPFLLAYPQVVRRAISRVTVKRANQAALELLEARSADEVLGPRDGKKVLDESIEAFAMALASIYEGRTSFSNDLAARTLRGRKIWLQVKGADTSDREPLTSVLVSLADVTHIKARQDAMAELVRAKDEFIARVSHEIRTPLTAVLGLTTEMTSMEGLTEAERSELMLLVADQAAEMSYMVEDLLVASRAEIGRVAVETRIVDLEVELQAAMDGLGLSVLDVPATIPEAVADPTRVRQIIRNLLTNAQRYGGSDLRVEAGSYFDKVWLEVRDNGDGVPENLARTIFEPYSTAHSGVVGSVGLGLSVSRHLAELMGGTLGYRRDGRESVFRLELPLAGEISGRSLASQMADA